MNLKSNIDLTYSLGDVNGSTESGIVEMYLGREQKDNERNRNFVYTCKTAEGAVIKAGWLPESITTEEADALYTAVKANLPDINDVGFSAWNEALNMEAARFKMADTFGVTVADIDIVS